MTEIIIQRQKVNVDLLSDELRTQFPGLVLSIIFHEPDGVLRVVVATSATRDERLGIEEVAKTHDATQRTPDQVTRDDRDQSDLFSISPDDVDTWVGTKSPEEFQRAMTRAFVQLRLMFTEE